MLKTVIIILMVFQYGNIAAQSIPQNETDTSAKKTGNGDAWFFFDDSITINHFDEFPSTSKKTIAIGEKNGYNVKSFDFVLSAEDRLIIDISATAFKPIGLMHFPDGGTMTLSAEDTRLHIDTVLHTRGTCTIDVCATKEEKTGDGEFYMTEYKANALAYTPPEPTSTTKDRLTFLEKQGKAMFVFIIDKHAAADVSFGYKNHLDLFATGDEAWINDAGNLYVQNFARNVNKEKAIEIYNKYLKRIPELLDDSWNLLSEDLYEPEFKKSVYHKCETGSDCKRFEKMKLVITKIFEDYTVSFVLYMPK